MAVSVNKAPKVSLPKAKVPKTMGSPKMPKAAGMRSYKAASKSTNGLKGAISKGNLAQLNMANLNRSY